MPGSKEVLTSAEAGRGLCLKLRQVSSPSKLASSLPCLPSRSSLKGDMSFASNPRPHLRCNGRYGTVVAQRPWQLMPLLPTHSVAALAPLPSPPSVLAMRREWEGGRGDMWEQSLPLTSSSLPSLGSSHRSLGGSFFLWGKQIRTEPRASRACFSASSDWACPPCAPQAAATTASERRSRRDNI